MTPDDTTGRTQNLVGAAVAPKHSGVESLLSWACVHDA